MALKFKEGQWVLAEPIAFIPRGIFLCKFASMDESGQLYGVNCVARNPYVGYEDYIWWCDTEPIEIPASATEDQIDALKHILSV